MITPCSGRLNPWTRVTLATICTLALVGCADGIFGVRGSGTMTTETRDVGDFSEVVLEGSGEVNIEISDTESLTIEAEDNLIPRLTAEVESGRLVLGTRGTIVTTRGIVYTITATSLERISVSGSGDIEVADVTAADFSMEISGSGTMEVSNLVADRLDVTISGSGDIDVSGIVTELGVSIPGSGSIDAEALEAAVGNVAISGSGAAVVNVTDTLDANVSGSGDIEYLGSPKVSSTISGSGSITPR